MKPNKSAEQTLALAHELGGDRFVEFVMGAAGSQAMATHVFPGIARASVNASKAVKPVVISMSRLCDRAYLIGLYEAWIRLAPPEA